MQGQGKWIGWFSRLRLRTPVEPLTASVVLKLQYAVTEARLGRLDQLACFHDLLSQDAPPPLQASHSSRPACQ
jgi:hypothetical protein